MLACVDVQYDDASATAKAAALAFSFWDSPKAVEERVVTIPVTEPYVPGQFYRRELPCVLEALRQITMTPHVVIVDGYVWLSNAREGLGAHLYRELSGVPVVGVAKKQFSGAPAIEVRRGTSLSPLFVTAAGMDPNDAAEYIRLMHGSYRIPTLLKQVDRLARGLYAPAP